MSGFVFKQRYKSPNDKAVRVLNMKHLIYIATRPGTLFNEGCGFGLWGRPPGQRIPQNIQHLPTATEIVGAASEKHTLYRVILSADEEMAQSFGLYEREAWEQLINKHINVIAREMNIDQKNFCWYASMHYKKTHPHVHILYWDNSGKPRNAHISEKRFEILSEKVRAEFNRGLYGEQIREAQVEQKKQNEQLRGELARFLSDADIPEALNLDRISIKKQDELGLALMDLVTHVPERGALRYRYLPEAYKEKVDAFLSQVLALPQFRAMQQSYLDVTDIVSDLYGNGEATKQHNRDKALQKLYTGLGNELMNLIRDTVQSLDGNEYLPTNANDLKSAIEPIAVKLLQSSPLYQQWLEALPERMTPVQQLRKDEKLAALERELTKSLAGDIRIRKCANAYQAQADKDKKLNGANLFSAVNKIIHEQSFQDKGYDKQLFGQMALRGLLRLFSNGAQQRNRAQGKLRQRTKDLSETARRDLRKKLSQQGSWDLEM